MKENGQKSKYNMWQNSSFMIKLAWTSKEKKVIILSLLSASMVVLLNIINLYISPSILSVLERHASIEELLMTIILFGLGLLIVSGLSAYIDSNVLYGRISVRSEIINLINRKAATTSYPNLNDEKFQGLLAKAGECTNSNRSATEAIWTTLTDLTSNILGFIFYIFLLMNVESILIVIVLVTALVSYFISNYLNTYGYRHRDEEAQYEKQMMYILSQSRDRSAAKDIRIFGLRPWIEELFNKVMDAYIAFHNKAEGVYIWARIIDLVLSFLRNGIAYIYLINIFVTSGISVAEFLLYFTAVSFFSQWVSGILSGLSTLYKQSLDISIVRECLEYPEIFKFAEGERLIPEKGQQYEIKLENVSFRYPNTSTNTLTNINLTLHRGEKLAIVGLNGAGKTTLIKLICGLLDPSEGRVLLNGKDIKDYNRKDYYMMFAAVFQNFSLLAGSIATNIAQSEDEIDMNKVKDSIAKAGLKKKIESLSKGYDTYLNREVYGDAIMLSGGEMQRLMLARALYKDAPFIVLDEPTAALDPIAESEMYQKYNEMTEGKSAIYISHRLASTRFCDRIILIDKTKISEEGSHEELLKRGGKYAELYALQSKYYQEGGLKDGE